MKTFLVTVEGLKKVDVEVKAESSKEAKDKIQNQLMQQGAKGLKFDKDYFDSIKVGGAVEKLD